MILTQSIILAIYVGLIIGGLFRPILGILGYLAIYMTASPDMWWSQLAIQYLPRPSLLAMVFLIVSIALHGNKLNWAISRREVEFYLFLVSVWLSSLLFGLGMQDNNWVYLEKITKLFVFIFVFIRIVSSIEDYDLVVWAFILGGVFLAYQAHGLPDSHFEKGRLDSLGGIDFNEANGVAAFLGSAVVLAGVKMLNVSWWKKAAFVPGIALMFNAIIMTQSRAAFLGALFAAPYILLRSPSEKRKQVYLFMALACALFLMLADVKFFERMHTIDTAVKTGTDYGSEIMPSRIDFWKAALKTFADQPLGVGIKNFEEYVFPGADAHNTYVLCLSEMGILGIVLLLTIVVEALMQVKRTRLAAIGTLHAEEVSARTVAIGAVLLAYLLGYMVTHSILYTEILWIFLAMPICLENATTRLLEGSGLESEEGTQAGILGSARPDILERRI